MNFSFSLILTYALSLGILILIVFMSKLITHFRTFFVFSLECAHGVVFAGVFYCLELPRANGTIQNHAKTLPCARRH